MMTSHSQWQDRLRQRGTDFVGTLPDELWVKIFKTSMEDGPAQVRSRHALRSFKRVTNPFLLNSVCKEWRRICKVRTEVWEAVFMAFEWMDGETKDLVQNFRRRVNALNLWILRAGTRAVELTYSMETEDFPFDSPAAMGLPRIVVYHAKRIRRLDCVVSVEWYRVFRGVQFPLLEQLDFTCGEYAQHMSGDAGYPFGHAHCLWTAETALDFAGFTPMLSMVRLEGSFSSIGVMLPWDQVTDVEIGHVERALAIEIIERLPNLRRCKIAMAAHVTDEDWLQSPDNHEQFEGRARVGSTALETLELETVPPSALGDILGIAPVTLKRIDVRGFTEPPADDGLVLDPLLPFAGMLETLTVAGHTFLDTTRLVEALSHLTALVSLAIAFGNADSPLDDAFVRAVFTTSGVLPHLQWTSVRTPKLQVGDEALLGFLRYRGHVNVNEGEVGCERMRDVKLVLEAGAVEPVLLPTTLDELGEIGRGGLRFVVERALPRPNPGL